MRLSLLVGALALAACGAAAQGTPLQWRRPVLVELYTSQGCSSCPAADALVRDLPRLGFGRDKVVPLTFHVDYWDELGWKDRFATPAFTERQTRYGHSPTLRSPDGDSRPAGLYTPQMVIDGRVHFSGARRELALSEIRRAAASPPPFTLTAQARAEGDVAVVTANVADPGSHADEWRVRAALALRSARTAVSRGENAGEQLEEAAVVRVLSDPAPLPHPTIRLRKPSDLRWSDVEIAVFVQSESTLEVAAAVGGISP
jgi:hypothetical protein